MQHALAHLFHSIPPAFACALTAGSAFAQSLSPESDPPSPLLCSSLVQTPRKPPLALGTLAPAPDWFDLNQPTTSAANPPPLAPTPDADEPNNGQDFTRPLRRLDLRAQYQDLGDDLEAQLFTLRVDWPIALCEHWQLSTRLDLPFMLSDLPSPDNPNGDDEFGSSDILLQGLLIHPLDKSLAIAFGSQLILPTASQDQFGTGRYRIVPTAAARYAPDWMPHGWWMAALARYDADFAGQDDRDFRQALVLQPILNIALPDTWFITLAPELRLATEDEPDWFIPFDVLVGRMLNPKTVISVEYRHQLVDDLPNYEWTIEFRIGFFF